MVVAGCRQARCYTLDSGSRFGNRRILSNNTDGRQKRDTVTTRFILAALAATLGSGAAGQEAAPPAEADAEAAAVSEPPPDARALAATCAACHGDDGNSVAPAYPSIAGQNARYLVRQMRLIRDGGRPAPLMVGQLDGYSDEDLAALAAYYAGQTPRVGQADPEANLALGEAIYRGGLLRKQVSACTACHAPDGSGNALAGFPMLAGQQPEYVVEQLRAYREGERTTDSDNYEGMMRQNAGNLTDGEMAAVANYLLGLH